MSKIALITDTHFGVRGDNPQFYEYFRKSFDGFFEVLDMENIKHVIHLGDLFDRRKFVNFVTASKCRTLFLEKLAIRDIETHIIAGNHDVYYKNTNEVNALRELVEGRYPNIHIYTEPTEVEIAGEPILLLPWITDDNTDATKLAISKTKATVAMAHLELSGYQMSRGVVAEVGMDDKLFYKFDSVFTGHYHHKSSRNNIHYLGAFCEFVWTDYGDARGFHVFDTSTRKTNFYENPHHIFKAITYDDVNDPFILTNINELDTKEFVDCYVKVIVVNKKNPFAFELLMDRLHKESTLDISVVDDVSLALIEDNFVANTTIETTPILIDRYVDSVQLHQLDPARFKNMILDVYKEAITLEEME